MAGTRAPRTPRRRGTPAEPKQPTAAPTTTAEQSDEARAAALLTDGGWQKLEDGNWFHQRKSRGNFLPLDAAYAMESRSREAASEPPLPDIDGAALGVDVKSPQAGLTADELAAQGGGTPPAPDPQAPAPPTPPPPLQTVERLAQQADAEARDAALARAEAEHTFAHDGIGGVIFWNCDHCRVNVRYSSFCTCERCALVKVAEKVNGPCPFCGHALPHGNR